MTAMSNYNKLCRKLLKDKNDEKRIINFFEKSNNKRIYLLLSHKLVNLVSKIVIVIKYEHRRA